MKECDYLYTQMVLKKVFTSDECRKIIAMDGIGDVSKILGYSKTNEPILSIRSSFSNFIVYNSENEWFFKKLWSVINQTNKKFFNFRIIQPTNVEVIEYNTGDF